MDCFSLPHGFSPVSHCIPWPPRLQSIAAALGTENDMGNDGISTCQLYLDCAVAGRCHPFCCVGALPIAAVSTTSSSTSCSGRISTAEALRSEPSPSIRLTRLAHTPARCPGLGLGHVRARHVPVACIPTPHVRVRTFSTEYVSAKAFTTACDNLAEKRRSSS